MLSRNNLSQWQALEIHADALQDMDLRDSFANDPERFSHFSAECDGLFMDYSKNHVTIDTMDLLRQLLKACGFEEQRDAMFNGEALNKTEGRPVLHTALRDPDCSLVIDGEHVGDFVNDVLDRMHKFSASVRSGDYTGYTGQAITDVVNIGIGGSDTGTRTAYQALQPFADKKLRLHFLSNVDARDLISTLAGLNPETTLFVIASKTFTTQETMINAQSAKEWVIEQMDARAIEKHFVGVTSNIEEAQKFGLAETHIYPLRPWIGGRYSLWSAIGLPLCITLGFKNFYELLKGAHAMDVHFRETKILENVPVLMALLSVWNVNFRGSNGHAILPYAYDLGMLPLYVQQVEMESNGKSVTNDGAPCDYHTSPIVFGEQGPNGQHAFYQALHQGSEVIPCDFVGIIQPEHSYDNHHQKLLANMIGQAQALMEGQDNKKEPHRYFRGNNPSTCFLLNRLDPYHLGMLMAAYEHKIFVEGIIWNINSFDQWGVELGKQLTNSILANKRVCNSCDTSTRGLLNRIAQVARSS